MLKLPSDEFYAEQVYEEKPERDQMGVGVNEAAERDICNVRIMDIMQIILRDRERAAGFMEFVLKNQQTTSTTERLAN